MRMSDPKEDAHMGTIETVRHPVDGAGKRQTLAGTSYTTDFGPGSEKQDLELVLLNAEPMEDSQIAFMPCEDFDIVGRISDDLGVYYTKTIKVTQGCPKPASLKGKLTCDYLLRDGSRVAFKAKGQERPNDVASFACALRTKDARLTGETLTLAGAASWIQHNDDGTTRPIVEDAAGERGYAEGDVVEATFSFPVERWPACGDVDLAVKVVDGTTTVFTQKLSSRVVCE
jgi:hypothetical protein